jgi:asparaginyl-tRNA synthetase
MYHRLADIQKNYKVHVESSETIEVRGWILNFRKQAENTFINLMDGSTADPLQIIVDTQTAKKYSIGSSIRVCGVLVVSPAKGQLYELKASEMTLEGSVADDYPIAKTTLSLEYLRNVAHLRARTKTFNSIFRIRHAMMMAIHKFYDGEGFLLLDPNIITTSECEGGAGVFQVTERDISIPKNLPLIPFEQKFGIPSNFFKYSESYQWSTDHFGKPVYLTVSSQLQLEALAMSMGRVYTMNKSFRSEHSNTHKHVSEFTHLEIEQCFGSFENLMDIAERFVKFTVGYILENNRRDLEILEGSAKFNEGIDKKIITRYENILFKKFHRITYKDAVELMKANGKQIEYGEDINSENEKFLVDYFAGPVFLTHWPIEIKSFYMKRLDDGTCESFDLLMPHVGELIGASQRETSYEKLVEIMTAKGIKREPLEFYLDLRKYGSCEHGGFGLGCDRLLMFLTGVHNIKDVIPFPVSYTNCDY